MQREVKHQHRITVGDRTAVVALLVLTLAACAALLFIRNLL